MPHRNAARVLPDPVGARISVWSPAAIAGQPCACAGVGSGNELSNQARTAGENRSNATRQLYGRSVTCPPVDSPAMAEYESPEWHPAFEEYCETIFELRED